MLLRLYPAAPNYGHGEKLIPYRSRTAPGRKLLVTGTPLAVPSHRLIAAHLEGQHYHFENFAKEEKRIIEGAIAYGRRAPGLLTYYQRRWRSVFGAA